MSNLNTVESMAIANARPENGKVAEALLDELQQHPEGIGGLIQTFQRNGMGPFVEQWCAGKLLPPNPTAIEGGLHGTGLMGTISERTGFSDGLVRGALAVVIPILVHHMVGNHHMSPTSQPLGAQPVPGDLLQSILARL